MRLCPDSDASVREGPRHLAVVVAHPLEELPESVSVLQPRLARRSLSGELLHEPPRLGRQEIRRDHALHFAAPATVVVDVVAIPVVLYGSLAPLAFLLFFLLLFLFLLLLGMIVHRNLHCVKGRVPNVVGVKHGMPPLVDVHGLHGKTL